MHEILEGFVLRKLNVNSIYSVDIFSKYYCSRFRYIVQYFDRIVYTNFKVTIKVLEYQKLSTYRKISRILFKFSNAFSCRNSFALRSYGN